MLQSQSSVDSSPSFYLFTSATVWIPFHKAPKRGSEHSTLLIVVAQLSSVTEIAPQKPLICVNRSPIRYSSLPAQELYFIL